MSSLWQSFESDCKSVFSYGSYKSSGLYSVCAGESLSSQVDSVSFLRASFQQVNFKIVLNRFSLPTTAPQIQCGTSDSLCSLVPSFPYTVLMGDGLNQETTTTTHSTYHGSSFACSKWCDHCYNHSAHEDSQDSWETCREVVTFSAETQSRVL